jgi:hypothetical protein
MSAEKLLGIEPQPQMPAILQAEPSRWQRVMEALAQTWLGQAAQGV